MTDGDADGGRAESEAESESGGQLVSERGAEV
jgi:hypothetical protein